MPENGDSRTCNSPLSYIGVGAANLIWYAITLGQTPLSYSEKDAEDTHMHVTSDLEFQKVGFPCMTTPIIC